MRKQPLYVYLATNHKSNKSMTTKVGCASDVVERLRLLNAPSPAPGSERRARHAPGQWRMLLVIVVPATLSARAIADQWARDARKAHCRFQYGVESIAHHYQLPYFVNFEELDENEEISSSIPELVTSLKTERVDDETTLVRSLAESLAANDLGVATTHFKNMSFATTDEPRRRYRKRSSEDLSMEHAVAPALKRVTPTRLDALIASSLGD